MEQEGKIELFEPVTGALARREPARPAPYDAMEVSEGRDLRSYWHMAEKRRWTIFSAALIIFTVTLIATLKEKPVYRAQALVEIQKENPNILTVQELFQFETVSDAYLETQYKILRSETLAQRVIKELHLSHVEEFNPSRPWWSGREAVRPPTHPLPSDPDAEQGVLRRFGDRLSIDPVRRSRLVQIGFDSQDPQLSAQAVNALTANYIQENLETRWEATQRASEWLSQQLEGVKGRLEKSEDDLQHYAEVNGLLFLESGKGQMENIVDERLRELQDELTKAQADRFGKESLYRLILAGDYSSLPGVVDNKLLQDLTVRLADLEREHAALTTTFTSDYPKVRQLQSQIDKIEKMIDQERKRAAQRISNDYLAAVRRETLVRQAFEDQQKHANVVATRSVQYNILKREVDTNKQLYEGLLQRLKEAGVSAGLKASNIRIVDAAVAPSKPVKPRLILNLALGLVIGMGCGVGIAFLQEHLDNTLKAPDDVERFLHAPALAMIPSRESLSRHSKGAYGLPGRQPAIAGGTNKLVPLEKGPHKSWIRIDANGTQQSALSEAFRSLRTSVLLSKADRPPRSLTFVSAEPGEGKTTVSCNLAICLAQLGKRVLLIDGDMRRPCIHKLFEIPQSAGLVGYLTGQQDWRDVVVPVAGREGLACLMCGPVPPNPTELISSERMHALLLGAMGEYHFVLIDSPPLLSVADGRILATMAESSILVAKGGVTPRELVQRAQGQVRDVGGHIIGVVLNSVDLHRNGYGYHYGYYRYGSYGRVEDGAETN